MTTRLLLYWMAFLLANTNEAFKLILELNINKLKLKNDNGNNNYCLHNGQLNKKLKEKPRTRKDI